MATIRRRAYAVNTVDEHLDMLMVCHHLDANVASVAAGYGLKKHLTAVRGCRTVKKNDEMRADSQLLACEQARELPMAHRYFLF